MTLEEQMKQHILNDCAVYFRKVARVFGQFLLHYETEHGKVDYDSFEATFFKVLQELIQNSIIVARGVVTPENMRFSEIGQFNAKH
jgi:hypothetical protein